MEKKPMNKLKKRFWIRQTDIVSNMALSGICKPVSMVLSYIYVPIVLDYLGVEKYGVWSTILTILSWVSYFDIGIGNGLRNRLTESLNKHDFFRIRFYICDHAHNGNPIFRCCFFFRLEQDIWNFRY